MGVRLNGGEKTFRLSEAEELQAVKIYEMCIRDSPLHGTSEEQ